MENEGNMTLNAACIEAVRTMYPKDYEQILAICKENGVNPETAIVELIDFLEDERKQAIKAAAVKIAVTKKSPGQKPETPARELSGFEKMAEYARRPA